MNTAMVWVRSLPSHFRITQIISNVTFQLRAAHADNRHWQLFSEDKERGYSLITQTLMNNHCQNAMKACNSVSIIVFYVWSRILREFLWVRTEHASVITTKLLRFNDSSWSTSPLITLSENNTTHVSPEIFAVSMISMTLERSGIRHWWLSSWISSSGDWDQSLLSPCLSLTPPSVLPVLSSSEPAPFTTLTSHSLLKYW